jgi:glucose-1-phosphate thymidylyltransferase
MRGLIVAGGLGTRLGLLTQSNNKHLLPIYDKPMIFYPLEILVKAGITEIGIVVSGPFAGNFIRVLNNGKDFNLKNISFFYQDKADGGIADAIKAASSFIEGHKVAVILGDNTTDADISQDVQEFSASAAGGAKIFLKEVPDPENFGCPCFNSDGSISEIIEKPVNPGSQYAVTGLYLFDELLVNFLDKISPSNRNQLEITDILNLYLNMNKLQHAMLSGYWQDAGTYDNLLKANVYWANKNKPII